MKSLFMQLVIGGCFAIAILVLIPILVPIVYVFVFIKKHGYSLLLWFVSLIWGTIILVVGFTLIGVIWILEQIPIRRPVAGDGVPFRVDTVTHQQFDNVIKLRGRRKV
jgi:hypothetical protein